MQATYHLTSAQDISTDILDAIKATFQSRPIMIIVEEEDNTDELPDELKAILDERLSENTNSDLSAEESVKQLNKKYGL
ncbi:MAG: hypothetical protein HC842_04740 [Cytophagales bacterium]|nr:hypothetical protein [Cytophagales bacterium]